MPWPPATPEYHGRVPQLTGGTIDEAAFHQDKFTVVKQVLADFRHLSFIERLISEYILNAQAALVPTPFVTHFIDSLRDTVSPCFNNDQATNEHNLSRLAEKVIENTSRPIEITSDTTFDGFVSMFTGDNCRLEMLGLTQCCASRACSLGMARDDDKHEEIVLALYRNTGSCLRLSRQIASDNNDVMLWTTFDYLRLTTHIEGDTSPPVYRRLGDMATYIYEFGIQRESLLTRNTPFFLAECRRKLFAAAYQFDKFISALLDRPPRILRRFSDVKRPLDLTDDELLVSQSEDQARMNLSPDGWSDKTRYIPATWHRLRYMLGSFREEILEYNYRLPGPETEALLRDLSRRVKCESGALPTHLRYREECWDSLRPNVCLMLIVVCLSYLQIDFEIHRLLEKSDANAWESSMTTALELVSVLLHLGTCLNRAILLRADFPYMVIGYGLPPVAFLTNALQTVSRSDGTQQLPPNVKRATLIRTLSVYVSHLDSIYRPGEGEYAICVQASKTISRVLDEVLDPSSSSKEATASVAAPQTPVSVSAGGETQQPAAFSSSQPLSLGADDLDLLNADALEGFDFSSWVKNINWTETGCEWSTF
ncbi:hypothetical protein PRZ48_010350 [Zasmidium cellare]|uniref:Transcription factor domain-containing protein n=1 Tax=Zasmidium cellare TaxID=395010 RepID=A0ABR0E8D7_ZASCE|nr:hypothetical protein PRZ48_010350 [Zasmidium cellare]